MAPTDIERAKEKEIELARIARIAARYGLSVPEYEKALMEHARSPIGWTMNFDEYAKTLMKFHTDETLEAALSEGSSPQNEDKGLGALLKGLPHG